MWKDWMKENKQLLIICVVVTLLVTAGVFVMLSPGGTRDIPEAKSQAADMPRFETVRGKAGSVLRLKAVPFKSDQAFINPDYSNFGLLDSKHLYIYDDANLFIYKNQGQEKEPAWSLAEDFLTKGSWQCPSTITNVSGKVPFLLIETFDEANAKFLIKKDLSNVPAASHRVLEKAVLMDHTRKGLSFAANTAVCRFTLDDGGLVSELESLQLEGIQTDQTNGPIFVRDIVTGYYDEKKGIHLVAKADKKIWVFSYKPDGSLTQQTSMSLEKFGEPKSITPVEGGVVLAASSGLTIIRDDGAVDVFDAKKLIERDSARMPAYVVGFDMDKSVPYICMAAKISDRSPTQFYIAQVDLTL